MEFYDFLILYVRNLIKPKQPDSILRFFRSINFYIFSIYQYTMQLEQNSSLRNTMPDKYLEYNVKLSSYFDISMQNCTKIYYNKHAFVSCVSWQHKINIPHIYFVAIYCSNLLFIFDNIFFVRENNKSQLVIIYVFLYSCMIKSLSV